MSVPGPLVNGASFQMLEDNGDTVSYNGGLDSKDGMEIDLQKDLGETFS